MTNLTANLRYAMRTLSRSPLFAAVAIVSLGLGIGANTAIFTLIDQIVLRKLPVKDPDSLVMLFQRGANNGSNMGTRMHSYPIYGDYRKAEAFAEVLCRRLISTSISIDNQTERVDAEMVSGNYFSMLGVNAAAGRVFRSQEDDQMYRGHPVVVLSHGYWSTRFASDPGVVGKKILVNNYPMTIVGVSAAGFVGLDPAQSPQIRVPILMKPVVAPEWAWLQMDDRRGRWVQVFARLKPGYTAQSAEAPLQVLYRQIREYEMTLPAAAKWSAYGREEFMKGTVHVENAATGYDEARAVSFYRDLIENLRAIPSVKAAAFTSVPLLHGWEWDSSMAVEGHQAKDGEDMQAFMNSPSPGYFETLGIPIIEGRDFDARDRPPWIPGARAVAIVNQRFAKHFFGERSAVGRHLGQGGGPDAKTRHRDYWGGRRHFV